MLQNIASKSRITVQVKSLTASSFYMTVPFPMTSTDFRTNQNKSMGGLLKHPAYSHNLLSRYFHLFGSSEEVLKSRTFASDGDMQEAAIQWCEQQKFFADGVHRIVYQWDSRLNVWGGVYLTAAVSNLWAYSRGFQLYTPILIISFFNVIVKGDWN